MFKSISILFLAGFASLAATVPVADGTIPHCIPPPAQSAPLEASSVDPSQAQPAHAVSAAGHIGEGTMYFQEGNAGSCGESHSDSDMIAALGHHWMGRQYRNSNCGQRLRATHAGSQFGVPGEGNSIEVTVVDSCDACRDFDVDFSAAAWQQLTNGAEPSRINISWEFI